jgi:lactoylglutathione lyase
MGKNLLKIRHLAFASEHPGKAAEFYKSAFGFQELSRFGLDPDRPDEARRPSGVFLTDGTLDIAILKFPENMLGKAGDQGIHHFGVVVEDVEAWKAKLEAMGAPCVVGREDIPPGAHVELKFRGPDGVIFDITENVWPGSEAMDTPEAKG